MGMFDYVEFKAPCWKCKAVLTDWQSKSGGCYMALLTPKQLGLGNFYTICPECDAWNEYDIIPKGVETVLNLKKSKLRS